MKVQNHDQAVRSPAPTARLTEPPARLDSAMLSANAAQSPRTNATTAPPTAWAGRFQIESTARTSPPRAEAMIVTAQTRLLNGVPATGITPSCRGGRSHSRRPARSVIYPAEGDGGGRVIGRTLWGGHRGIGSESGGVGARSRLPLVTRGQAQVGPYVLGISGSRARGPR